MNHPNTPPPAFKSQMVGPLVIFSPRFNINLSISHQSNALKTIRYLQHNKYASSGPGPLGNHAPREAWSSKPAPALISRSSNLSQRSSNAATPARIGMNKSKYLAVTCVRHVIQHCGGYLLDSLGPPVPPTLGMTTLMVLREAVMNGEVITRILLIAEQRWLIS